MTWAVTAEPERFDEAVEWFANRMPLTDELAQAMSDYAGPRAWKIAGVSQLDVVFDIYSSLQRAIAKGTPFAEWQREVESTLTEAWGRKDAHRIETIFLNATQQAHNAGRLRQMNDPVMKRLRPFRQFDGIADARQSDTCKACDGTVLAADDPWWDSHSPQLHHRCRSKIRALSAREAQRIGGVTERPPEALASAGFGKPPDVTDWEPDPAKYPSQVFAEYERKLDEIRDKAKRKRARPAKEAA